MGVGVAGRACPPASALRDQAAPPFLLQPEPLGALHVQRASWCAASVRQLFRTWRSEKTRAARSPSARSAKQVEGSGRKARGPGYGAQRRGCPSRLALQARISSW